MHREEDMPPREAHIDRVKVGELERQGFQVQLTRSRSQVRCYCRIRSNDTDRTFFGETNDIAISKALESINRHDTRNGEGD